MKLNKILAMVVACLVLVGCYENYEDVPRRTVYADNTFAEQFPNAEHITIAELKQMFTDEHGSISQTGQNSSWNDTKYVHIEDDLYIKGKVVSNDEQGNIYKSLHVQDETAGIEIKLNNNVGLYYPYGSWVYVRLKDLYIGNYRMMLSIGGAPSESYNKAGEHKFYANSNLDIQTVINRHIFPGGEAEIRVGSYEEWLENPGFVDVITVTKDNYKTVFNGAEREKFFGRLIRFEGLTCHYSGVANQQGYTAPAVKNGSYDNIYPSWMYTDPRPTVSKPWYRWAFRETDYTADGQEYATGRSLYVSVLFTYRDDLIEATQECNRMLYYMQLNPDDAATKAEYEAKIQELTEGITGMQGSQDGIFVVRSSGYSRFANRPLCKDGEKANITAIFGIYSKQSDYTGDKYDYATYQLTLNNFEDMEFEKGTHAFLTEEQVEAMTTDDMKYVEWMDEEGEIGE